MKIIIGPTGKGDALSVISRAVIGKPRSTTLLCIMRETYMDMRLTPEYKGENSNNAMDASPTIFGYRFSLYNEPDLTNLDESIKEVFH